MGKLSVVIISRNESTHIRGCIESVLAETIKFPQTQVVLVDSDSSDDTRDIAAQFPISILHYINDVYSAAAGRRIGFSRVESEYVFFIDGDCWLKPKWLSTAIECLESHKDVAVVYGERTEHVAGTERPSDPTTYDLGGNALYRAEVLRNVGSFNPFIVAEEEAELFGRIHKAGYKKKRLGVPMIRHDRPRSYNQEARKRYWTGKKSLGQILRLSFRQGSVSYHVSRLSRYLFFLVYLTIGLGLLIHGLIVENPTMFGLWLLFGLIAFLMLCVIRRSVSQAFDIFNDWASGAISIIPDFLRRPHSTGDFSPTVEQVK